MSGVQPSRLDAAAGKLDRALAQFELRLTRRLANASAQAGDLFDADRSRLATDLDHSRARESELAEAVAAATEALDMAIAELRALLDAPDSGEAGTPGELD